MNKQILLVIPLLAVCSTGCMTYRHRSQIADEAKLRSIAPKTSDKYRLVEFRFRSDLEQMQGKEQVVNGKSYTEWLATERPDVFSTSEDAIPLIVRQTMTVPSEWHRKQSMQADLHGLRPSIFDIIVTQCTLGLWPATIACDFKFETEIQLNEADYAPPFVWNTKYQNNVANTIVAYLYYPSSSGWETAKLEKTMKRVQEVNRLQRTSISRKSSEDEKQAAKTELIWQWGALNSPEVMKRGAGLGIVCALAQLTPEQRQAVRDNPVARYLADKADGKLPAQEEKAADE